MKKIEEDFDLKFLIDEVYIPGWREISPDHADEMLADYKRAMSFLTHANPIIRELAIDILMNCHEAYCEIAPILRSMANEDENPTIQECALVAFVVCACRMTDPDAGRFLAALVKDSSRSLPVRLHAYEGLFHLRKMPRPSDHAAFRFPADIDWTFVDSFG